MKWLRYVSPKGASVLTPRGYYLPTMRKMHNPDKVTKIDFLPAGILKEIREKDKQ